MDSPILLTGGTGTLGSRVLPLLKAAGGQVRVLTRRPRDPEPGVAYAVGDLATGAGVPEAVTGVGTVLHCAGSAKGDAEKACRLVAAASRAGVGHLVFISVVGADRVPMAGRIDRAAFGYFGAQHAAEQIVAGSGLPWTTLRATQFHDLILTTVQQLTKLPVVPVPSGFRFQPVDTGEVAARLVELALGPPSGLVPDLAGPEIYEFTDLVRGYLRASGRRRPLVPVRMPGRAAAAMRAGANLAPDRAVGRVTWEQFLGQRVPVPA